MKATFRLPSKAVQYGYVEVSVDVPEDPDAIGRMYQAYVEVFQKGEKAQKALSGPAHPALAPEVIVNAFAPEETAQDVLKAQEEFLSSADDAKQVMLDAMAEADDIETVDIKAVIEDILGPTTVVDETAAPWESEAPAPKKKPWETSGTPKKAPVVNLFG